MKYFSIILNVILAIAVIVLYVLYFSTPGEEKAVTRDASDSLKLPTEINIAYIMEDSLLTNYEFFKELAADLDKKRQNLENDYNMKAEGLQKEIEGFQRTAGNMTMNQARAVEEDLLRKRQNLMMLQESMAQDLMKSEADVNNKLYNKVTQYLDNYAKENDFALILNVKRGNAVLYGHKGMDITETILNGLNEDYKASSVPSKPVAASDSTKVN